MHLWIRAMAIAGAVVALLGVAGPAVAHEDREVGGGEAEIALDVGFGNEPAFAGQPNSVEVGITDHGEPMSDIGNGLKVEVTYGDATRTFSLEPNAPGDYRAWFIPTRPGKYTFRIFGAIEHDEGTEEIDESFTSGPNTFAEVENPATASFPVGDPTSGELGARVEQEAARTQDAASAASTARLLAIVAVALGAIALVAALAGRRRKAA